VPRVAREVQLREAIGFLWGFAEATLFFIVPDVWIAWVALTARRAVWGVLGFTMVGALLGGAVMYTVSTTTEPETTAALLDGVPTVDRDAIQQVDDEMREHGPRSVLYGPLRMGTPYKLYARSAGVQDKSLAAFLLWSIPGRLERLLLITVAALLVGTFFRTWIAAHRRRVLALYAAAWLAFYGIYVARIGF
jgi:membrane protein YqaA with SNARE-associated domain